MYLVQKSGWAKMNVLFLTLLDFNSIGERNIYTDLLREFVKNGHQVYVISPVERRRGKGTKIVREKSASILKLKIGNIQKTNLIEKGISTIMVESVFIAGIKKYFADVKFDLLLYSTPPITFQRAVEYVKKRDRARTYLLLKDIFPQNSVDIGLLSRTGVKSLIYTYFRKKEKRLYAISDWIGCMSQANVEYVLKHNPEIDPGTVEVCPNSIDVIDRSVDEGTRAVIRKKYGLPLDKTVFIYGGNLGKPQGIDFLIKCLHGQRKNGHVFFLVVGDGTEQRKLERFMEKYPQDNLKLMKHLPREDYDRMVGACDIGMIFLDHRFTIPNFPSRLLTYMQAKIPVLACTDPNTDIGKVIVEGGFGWWCESDDTEAFHDCVEQAGLAELKSYGIKGYAYLETRYSVESTYKTISASIGKGQEGRMIWMN